MSELTDLRQKVIDEMGNNTVVIFGDADGARIFAKLRGCTPEETGFIMGVVKASINRQIGLLKEQWLKLKGPEVHNEFIDGMKRGERVESKHDGIKITERGERNG